MNRNLNSTVVFVAFLLFSLCLNAAMKEVWSKSFPLEGDSVELAGDIKLDNIKNSIYITGLNCIKEGEGTRGIVAVRKIDLEGKQIWKQICDIGVGGADENNTLAVDKRGNVYVAGYNNTEKREKILWLRKYDPNGGIIWDKIYDMPSDGLDAEFKDMAVDADENIYACGYKYTDKYKRDLWIRKYDGLGNEIWKDVYSRSENPIIEEQGLAVGPKGNVFVSVFQNGENQEYLLTIKKYDLNGKVLLLKQYQADGDENRIMNRIVVDVIGNIYIAGSEAIFSRGRNVFVRKFDESGLGVWSKTFPATESQYYTGIDLKVDRRMNVFVSATGGADKDEKKYSWISGLDKKSNELWLVEYSGYSYGVKFSIMEDGAVYALGTETDKEGNSNIWVKKYMLEKVK